MKKPEFNPGEFSSDEDAALAQAKFDEWFKQIENAPVVYGVFKGGVFTVPDPRLGLRSGTSSPETHTARLVDIQEIKKEPCKHEPDWEEEGVGRPYCKHCGCELVADWREK